MALAGTQNQTGHVLLALRLLRPARLYMNEADLVDGSTYTTSFIVGNSGTSTVNFTQIL